MKSPGVGLTDRVYRQMKQAILSAEWRPGEILLQEAIAEELGVSRTPVREAGQRLEREHLVHILPRRGMQVSEFSVKDVREGLQIRQVLEGFVVSELSKNPPADIINKLRSNIEESKVLLDSAMYAELFQKDKDFHMHIINYIENGRISEIIQNIMDQSHIYKAQMFAARSIPGAFASSIAEHEGIVSAISRNDPDMSCAAVRDHYHNFYSRISNHW